MSKIWYNKLIAEPLFIPKIAVIELTNNCYYNCTFCNKDKGKMNQMPFETFKVIVNKYIELGVESFELTPTIGDAVVLKDFNKYINYVLSKNKKVFFFTSLGTLDFDPEFLKNIFPQHKDFYAVISVYGLTFKAFNKVTTSPLHIFKLFKKNLLYILNEFKNTNRTLIFRNRNKNDEVFFKQLSIKYKCDNFRFETFSGDSNCTDKSLIQERDNICCNFIINPGCDIHGNIKGCMYGGYDNNFIIGNVFTDDLNEIYSNYFKKNLENDFCRNCILYDSIELKLDCSVQDIKKVSYTFSSFLEKENFNIGKTN